jgi:hypothetical protein
VSIRGLNFTPDVRSNISLERDYDDDEEEPKEKKKKKDEDEDSPVPPSSLPDEVQVRCLKKKKKV